MQWFVLAFVLCLPHFCQLLEVDYYWRDYFGKIPPDAVVAGRDIGGGNVYVGQGYVKNGGLAVAQINPGEKEVYVPYGFVGHRVNHVKILCGPQQNFFWINVNSTNVYDLTHEKNPILGGHDDNIGTLRVARINVGGDTRIGKCAPKKDGVALFHYVLDGREQFIEFYQVLIYKEFEKVVGVL